MYLAPMATINVQTPFDVSRVCLRNSLLYKNNHREAERGILNFIRCGDILQVYVIPL